MKNYSLKCPTSSNVVLCCQHPKRNPSHEEEEIEIRIPGFRYDQIAESVMNMYEVVGATAMPISSLDTAIKLGYQTFEYHSLSRDLYNFFSGISHDAVSCKINCSGKIAIFYNSWQTYERLNFTLMHEIGHLTLGHCEASALAEKEANYFAGLALCPIELLEHYEIYNPASVSKIFDISFAAANYAVKRLKSRKGVKLSETMTRFGESIIRRFKFQNPYQIELNTNEQ